MYNRSSLKLAAIICGASLLAACSAGPTAPDHARSITANAKAAHDDPPQTPCRSGWQLSDGGEWVCTDP